jgi:hypothetical protein
MRAEALSTRGSQLIAQKPAEYKHQTPIELMEL